MSRMPTVRRLISAAWSSPRSAGGEGPRRRDVAIVVALALATLVEGSLRTDLTWPLATTLVTLVLLPGLGWRRSHPLPVTAAMSVLMVLFALAQAVAGAGQDALATMFALIAVPHALFRWGSGRERILGAAALLAGLACSSALGPDRLEGAVAGTVFLGGACLVGALRRERVESRARQLDSVRTREREALARDLHDTMAHRASTIAIRAQVAGEEPGNVSRVSESLAVIEHQAQSILTDMRALVRTLREPADYAPSAGLAELERLADSGPPPVAVQVDLPDDVAGIVATTLFRIAQEGVTNARRHAHAATVIDVSLTVANGAAQVTVHDDGTPTRTPAGDGHGLRGMAERVALLGGEVTAGPSPGGGWTLRATLPLDGAA
ncbi:sensor histidine kinase [Aeromicrobium sp. CTD01-1L150]|uniref:sensor histidine kinase n=1 Tax=Aeromicrobium sp. CTD01-1L150 TaxID=3341830 RepID=UPI0035BF4BEA